MSPSKQRDSLLTRDYGCPLHVVIWLNHGLLEHCSPTGRQFEPCPSNIFWYI